MNAFASYQRRFSPYLDDNPLLDLLDDDAQRMASIIAGALFVHVALFFVLSANFIVPDLLPDEPDIVPVQIVTYQEPAPEPEIVPEPAPEIIQPAVPAPAIAPRPKPVPQPVPQPIPEPIPEAVTPPPPPPEPEPEPEPVVTPPPPPEVLSQPVVEPEPEPVPEPDPIPEPEPEPAPIPKPVIEIFEPVPEPEPEPIVEPEPLPPIIEIFEPEPIPEPEPEPEPIPEPVIEIFEPEPVPEPELPPLVLPEPAELPPAPGIITPEPLPEILPEPLPLPDVEPEIIPEPEPVPPAPEPEPEFITVAPTILASPEAPETSDEADRAVTEEEADPFLDLLKREQPLGPNNPGTVQPRSPLAGPTTGGGNIGVPPTTGTRREGPGTGGWTLAPGSWGNSPGAGYEGINLDMRCREAGKTHLECPEFLKTFQGRDANGLESTRLHIPRGTDRGPGGIGGRMTSTRASNAQIAGGSDPWKLGIGNNSVNAGGPSTTILDDGPEVDFSREFLSNPVRNPDRAGRLRDLIQPEDDADDELPELIFPDP